MTTHNHDAVTSSVNPNWATPKWLFETLHEEFHFLLDAAADGHNHLTIDWLGPDSAICEDGLVVPWYSVISASRTSPADAIFFNPPYSQKLKMPIAPWFAQAATAGEHCTVVGVVPYAPQTKHWRKYVVGDVYRATEIRIFPYRIKFDPPPDYEGNAPGANVNTAVVIWKPSDLFVDPWTPHLRYWSPRPGLSRGNNDDED